MYIFISKISSIPLYIVAIPSTTTILLDLTGIAFGMDIPVPLGKYSGMEMSLPSEILIKSRFKISN